MTPKAVGADCFASKTVTIEPWTVKAVPTGIKAKFNGETEGLFPFIRSSIPKKKGLILANGVGVVEEDYYGNPDNDGDLGFMFLNFSNNRVTVERFERLGQIVLMPILRFENAGRAGLERGQSGSTGK
jgi:dUTP pyrophosphatase